MSELQAVFGYKCQLVDIYTNFGINTIIMSPTHRDNIHARRLLLNAVEMGRVCAVDVVVEMDSLGSTASLG